MTQASPLEASPSRGAWNPLSLAWLASTWLAVFANWPLWQTLHDLPEMSTPRGIAFMLAFCGIVMAGMALCLTLAAWRWSIKPVIAVFLVSSAAGAYFMGTYRIVIDPTMMLNVMQTDWHETRDLLSIRLVSFLMVLAVLPLWWLWRVRLAPLRPWPQLRRNGLSLLGAAALLAGLMIVFFADMSGTMRNHKSIRYLINPLNSFYALGVVAAGTQSVPAGPAEAIGTDAHIRPARSGASRPPLLILVVGETARAANFSLNGYARPTNPALAARLVMNFSQVTSCGTNTAASVPCMFSSLGKAKFQSDKRSRETLLDVVQHAGMAVLWIDNQAGCKGVCDRVPHVQAAEAAPGVPPLPTALCQDGECLDEALLHGLDERLAALPADQRARGVLLVMHQMGSHGPAYAKRSPPDKKPFTPECQTNVLQQCERQSLINAYDNSIAYTDQVLAQAIDWLKAHETHYAGALLYLSDHGESLGENNLYLHGLPFSIAPSEQTHVPMVAWLSTSMQTASGVNTGCMADRLALPLSHDNLYHTTLGLLGVDTTTYLPPLDVFSACRSR